MFRYNTVEEALEELRKGKIVLVTDDENRENEGDMICAAEFATTENVNFMAMHTKGLICMPMSREICSKLRLPQMIDADENTDNHCTAFTVSIDHVNTTTGISLRREWLLTTVQSLKISAARGICFLLWRRKTEFSSARDILKRPSI